MIKTLTVENFKSIKHQKVNLGMLNILIGQNGAGKSNFISLFKFLKRTVDQQLSDYIFQSGGIGNFLFNGPENSQHIKFHIELGTNREISNTYGFTLISSGDDYRIQDEFTGYWIKSYSQPTKELIGHEGKDSALKLTRSPSADYVYRYIRDLHVYHFHDTSDNAPLKLPQPIEDVYVFKNEAENIAPFLYYLQEHDQHTYFKIVETIRLVYPQFNDFELSESPTAKGKIVIRWSEKGTDNIFTVRQMSDGTLRFICLAVLLLIPVKSKAIPGTIILDEPELGLHPYAIHVLSELIKKASMDRQVIIATQSVTLINHFSTENLLILERGAGGETVLKSKNSEEISNWLNDFTLGELWENNFLGGRP